jgi:hypothetical protein
VLVVGKRIDDLDDLTVQGIWEAHLQGKIVPVEVPDEKDGSWPPQKQTSTHGSPIPSTPPSNTARRTRRGRRGEAQGKVERGAVAVW